LVKIQRGGGTGTVHVLWLSELPAAFICDFAEFAAGKFEK
jgi:hypothetical protein